MCESVDDVKKLAELLKEVEKENSIEMVLLKFNVQLKLQRGRKCTMK